MNQVTWNLMKTALVEGMDDNKKENMCEVFDLVKDPYEDNNISHDKQTVSEMEDILQNILKNYTVNEFSNNQESEEIEQELHKLGYL